MKDVVFNDYASWLIENDEFLKEIKEKSIFVYEKYESIFKVVAHLYDLKVANQELTLNEEEIFASGFYFLYIQIENIKLIKKSFFNESLKELKKEEKAVSLYLDVHEFINIIDSNVEDKDITKPLIEIENEILLCFKEKRPLREEIYEEFDNKLEKLYKENDIEFYSIASILYSIAEIYDLI